MNREIRRNQSILYCTGTGIILFGVWDIVKTMMFLLFDYSDFISQFVSYGDGEDDRLALGITIVLLIIILLIVLRVRAAIGRRAIRLSRERELTAERVKQARFLPLATLCAALSLSGIWSLVFSLTSAANDLDRVMSLIAEVTSASIFIEMIFAGIRLKRLLAKQTEEVT